MSALTTFPSPSDVQPKGVNDAEIADAGAREAFIPYQRDDLIAMCLNEGLLSDSQCKDFEELSEILMAHLHFEFLESSEAVKNTTALSILTGTPSSWKRTSISIKGNRTSLSSFGPPPSAPIISKLATSRSKNASRR
jgi:hypothetical protein